MARVGCQADPPRSLFLSRAPRGAFFLRPADAGRSRRRGDRVEALFAALHMSTFGTKQTCPSRRSLSALGGKADNICSF
jgi:hypothetical protein